MEILGGFQVTQDSSLNGNVTISGNTYLNGPTQITTSNWSKFDMITGGTTAQARIGSDSNGLDLTTNANWSSSASAWFPDTTSQKAFSYVQNVNTGRHEFKTGNLASLSPSITWTTSVTIDDSGLQAVAIGNLTPGTGTFTTANISGLQVRNLGNVTPGFGYFAGLQSVAIGNITPGTGAFTTASIAGLQAVAIGNVTPGFGYFAGLQSVAIGNVTPGTGAFTTLSTSGVATINGNLVAASGTASSSTSTGALIVVGGLGVSGAAYHGSAYDNGNRVITSVTASAGTGISISGATTTGPSAAFTINNTGVTTLYPGTGVSTTASTGAVTVSIGQSVATTATPTFAGMTSAGSIVPSATTTYNLGSSSYYWSTIYGTSTSAEYADLAENYLADSAYEPGTVVVFGGSAEITTTTQMADVSVAGAISTKPAHLMNSGLNEGIALALRGRIPLKLVGPVYKGELLVTSTVAGYAMSVGKNSSYGHAIFAKSLTTDLSDGPKVIEAVIL
jgi:hypothetical protein